jgi:putative NIF3 family GTP cyclohydrolase 1 type 2
MTSEDIIEVALDLAGLTEIPADSGVHVRGDNVKNVLATIDCDVGDLLLARELKCDTVLTHHPEGAAALNGWRLILNQVDQMVECGVPIARAEAAVQRRLQQVELNSHARNYARVVQAAQLLNLAFLNIHVPCDLITRRLIIEKLARFNDPKSRATVAEVVDALQEFPEQRAAATLPQVRLGAPDRFAGRVAVAMGGYTGGGVDVLRAYYDAGVGTLLMMHVPEADLREAQEQKLAGNLIVTGHMASDSIGINFYLDELQRLGLKVIRAGGIVAPE